MKVTHEVANIAQGNPGAAAPVEPEMFACPFCGSPEVELEEDPTAGACGDVDVWVQCLDCNAQGSHARIGCRDEEDEDAPNDGDWRPLLQREAVRFWNACPGRINSGSEPRE